MYSRKDFKKQIQMLYIYYKEPARELIKRSKLTKPTVYKFLKGGVLRSYNQDTLMEQVITMNEEAIAKRKALQERAQKVVQLELELEGANGCTAIRYTARKNQQGK